MNSKNTILHLQRSLLDYIGQTGSNTVGLGQSAYSRMGAANFLTNYSIICVKDSLENEVLKKQGLDITSCTDIDLDIHPRKSEGILSSDFFKNYIKQKNLTHVLVYKTTAKTQQLINELGLNLVGNSAKVSEKFENKDFFFSLIRKLKLPYSHGKQVKRQQLASKDYEVLVKKYGKFVIQRTDMDKGGGLSTYFIFSKEDFDEFLTSDVSDHVILNISKFIDGKACSATGCVTKHGVLCSPLQYQLMDIPQVTNTGMKGVWCGHDWSASKHFSNNIQEKKNKILKTIGQELFKLGYRGIFGIDFMLDEQDKLYPIECNPRYTGAFPAYTFLQLAKQQAPLELFHLLEHYDIDYDLDVDETNKQLTPFEGSQLILKSFANKEVTIKAIPKPGKYRFHNGQLEFLHENNLPIFKSSEELVVCDAVPKMGNKVAVYDRIGKIIFADQISREDLSLNNKAEEIVNIFYSKLHY